MKRKSQIFFCTAAVLHLLLVIAGAMYTEFEDESSLGRFLDFYSQASGANSSYGFFTPTLGGKVEAVFDIMDQQGKKIDTVHFARNASREVQIRLGGLYEEFTTKGAQEDKVRQTLAGSLTSYVFGEYPTASHVIFRVEDYWPITMAEYRQGKRSDWEVLYEAKFARD